MEFDLAAGMQFSVLLFGSIITVIFIAAYVYQFVTGLRGPGKNTRRVEWLKFRARHHWRVRENIYESLNCGRGMAENVSVNYNEANTKYLEILTELKQVDKEYPKGF